MSVNENFDFILYFNTEYFDHSLISGVLDLHNIFTKGFFNCCEMVKLSSADLLIFPNILIYLYNIGSTNKKQEHLSLVFSLFLKVL